MTIYKKFMHQIIEEWFNKNQKINKKIEDNSNINKDIQRISCREQQLMLQIKKVYKKMHQYD